MKKNLINKFVYKLFFLTFILLLTVVLDRISIINLEYIKMHMSENFNFVKITKTVNGTLNIFDLGDDVINVSLNDSFSTILDENKYLYKQKSNNVYSTYLGSIVKINKINDKYQVEILDENNKLIIISDLQEVKVKMYQIVKINDLIGVASEINNNLNSEYKYYYLLTIDEN